MSNRKLSSLRFERNYWNKFCFSPKSCFQLTNLGVEKGKAELWELKTTAFRNFDRREPSPKPVSRCVSFFARVAVNKFGPAPCLSIMKPKKINDEVYWIENLNRRRALSINTFTKVKLRCSLRTKNFSFVLLSKNFLRSRLGIKKSWRDDWKSYFGQPYSWVHFMHATCSLSFGLQLLLQVQLKLSITCLETVLGFAMVNEFALFSAFFLECSDLWIVSTRSAF